MTRLHAKLVSGAERLGWPGVLGLGLIAFSAGFYLSTVRPGQLRVEQLRGEVFKLAGQDSRAARETPASAREQLSAFYGFFPAPDRTAAQLGVIFAVAEKQALSLELGDYRILRENVGGLTHYQLVFPFKGSYPQVRKFVAATLRQVPNLSLDSIEFERQKVGDATLNAKVKFVMYLGRQS